MLKIRDYFTENELIELTQELIRIPSHKNAPNQEREVAEFIYDYCKKNDIEVEIQDVIDGRKNVIAYLRGDDTGRSLILNGHLDTVTPNNMIIDPFGAEIKNGYIWGRGSVDMKGPVASMLMSMVALKRSGTKLGGDVIFTGVIGEEGKSEGTEHLIKSGMQADGAIVGEPTNHEYAFAHRGLEWLDIIVEGKSAHSGTPDKGINAIDKATVFMKKLMDELYPKLHNRYNKYMGESKINFGTMHCGTEPSTVAGKCTITIDRRYLPTENPKTVLDEIKAIINEINRNDPYFHAKIELDPESSLDLNHPPLFTPIDSPIVKAVQKSIKEVLGSLPSVEDEMGWTDAALLSTYCMIPTVVYGPGDLALAHTEDERIPIKDLVIAVEVYALIIDKFCNKK